MRRLTIGGAPRERIGVWIALAVVAGVLAWILFVALPQGGREPAPTPAARAGVAESAVSEADPRKIAARIFYVGDSGALVALEQDVPLADDPAEQARAIVRAQVNPVEPPLVSAIPAGTTLRALFLTPRGEAYVDLSREVTAAHPGGSVAELLTVYSIVHALTANMPAVTSVQILVDGREVDTLAGHVNLRRPLAPNPDWIQ